MPTSETPSIAISLPRKIASSGTAAASTSITLFDFSSTRLESSMPARSKVRMKISDLSAARETARMRSRLPADCAVTTVCSVAG